MNKGQVLIYLQSCDALLITHLCHEINFESDYRA